MTSEVHLTGEDLLARLLHRDALMLVVDKPAGLPVHAGPGGGRTLTDHLPSLRFGLPRDPELAHRLDRDTSGCLVLGRHRQALARLGALFAGGHVGKTYWAVVEGGPTAESGEIDLALSPRDPASKRSWWMRADPAGQPALTRWRVMGRDDGTGGRTWLALEPVTGRTHQLRVHCSEMGWPILGDTIYGSAPRSGGPRLHLHSRRVEVPLYPRRPPVAVEAGAPTHMAAALGACGLG